MVLRHVNGKRCVEENNVRSASGVSTSARGLSLCGVQKENSICTDGFAKEFTPTPTQMFHIKLANNKTGTYCARVLPQSAMFLASAHSHPIIYRAGEQETQPAVIKRQRQQCVLMMMHTEFVNYTPFALLCKQASVYLSVCLPTIV